MIEKNKEIARRWLLEFWHGDYSLAHELHTPNYTRHADSPFPVNSPDAYVEYVKNVRKSFPDLTFKVEDVVAEGEKVVIRWTNTGTHLGEMMGIPATGRKILGRGMDMLRFENGKIAETWNFPDEWGMCVQIGRFPEIK